MSNAIFPSLPGLKYDQEKSPVFSTVVQSSISGRELRCAYYVYPIFQFDLSFELLRDNVANNEFKNLYGFYLQRQGAFDSFLYIDPTDSNVTGQFIATAPGNQTVFQMVRTYGGFNMLVTDIQQPANNVPPFNVYINANLQSANNYTVTWLASGNLTFNAAPANGANITADFSYYYRCRFVEFTEDRQTLGGSGQSFTQFMANLWQCPNISFVSCR